MSESENSSLKRQIEELREENKRLKKEIKSVDRLQVENARLKQDIQCHEVKQAMEKLQAALKPRYFRLDYLVCNIPHIAIQIFRELDPQSHGNCHLVSKEWKDCIDNSKWWWQQQIEYHCSQLKDSCRYSFSLPVTKKKSLIAFRKALQYVSKEESVANLELVTMFMRDYIKYIDTHPEWHRIWTIPTPLYFAAERNRGDVFQVIARSLVINDWDIDISDEKRNYCIIKTLLGRACFNNQNEIVEFYMNLQGDQQVNFNKLQNGSSLFHEACKSNKLEVVKLFLDRAEELNIELNVRGDRGITPLMGVVNKEVMKLLLSDERIDVAAIDEEGCNVLHHVCMNHLLSIPTKVTEEQIAKTITLLLQSCKIPFMKSFGPRGSTPLHHACIAESPERIEAVLKYCLEKNINVNEADNSGETAVHIAFGLAFDSLWHAGKVLLPVIKVFFDFAKKLEINFEASDDEGLTPIHTMCRNMTSLQGKKEYFENFLTLAKTEYGIEFNLKAISHDGKTPFEMLCQD